MTAVPFPLLSAPGRQSQASGGRLINCYPEKLSATAGQGYVYPRVAGLVGFGTSPNEVFRGALPVGATLYALLDQTVYSFASGGGAGAPLSGVLPGTARAFMARDNASPPNVVIVAPGDGAYVISGGAVVAYPDADVGQPNSVKFTRGVFVFTYGDGSTRNSDVNSTNINTLSVASAESKPDTLYCPMPLGNGQILLAGSSSTEVWGGQNDTGYFFSYIATIARGIVGPYAICGDEDGWGKGIFLVGDDFKVHQLNGYTPTPISVPDLDRMIENEVNKVGINIGVYVAQGHGMVVVRGTDWCWEYDTTLQSWHERQSYLSTTWRSLYPFKAFDKWLCGDSDSGNILQITAGVQTEVGDPMRMRIETGPLGAFPSPLRINEIELYLTRGVGIATGDDPVETDPDIEVSMSRDGGNTWTKPRVLKVGRQALTAGRIRSAIWGQADNQGVLWRFDCSSSVPLSFMGADMLADKLR